MEEARNEIRVMESITSLSLEDFMSDIRNRYTLRMAIVEFVEAAITASARILRESQEADEKIEGYIETARKLMEKKILNVREADALEKLIRLRNIIIHPYWEVDDRRIYNEARGNGIEAAKRIVDGLARYVQGC